MASYTPDESWTHDLIFYFTFIKGVSSTYPILVRFILWSSVAISFPISGINFVETCFLTHIFERMKVKKQTNKHRESIVDMTKCIFLIKKSAICLLKKEKREKSTSIYNWIRFLFPFYEFWKLILLICTNTEYILPKHKLRIKKLFYIQFEINKKRGGGGVLI